MRVLGVNNYNINNNCRKPHFGAKVGKHQITNVAQSAKADSCLTKLSNRVLSLGVAVLATLLSLAGCMKDTNINKNKMVDKPVNSRVYDSIAWAEFEKWDDAHIPYWDQPGYDGPIMKEDFLEWQDQVNAWWDTYYSGND